MLGARKAYVLVHANTDDSDQPAHAQAGQNLRCSLDIIYKVKIL